jgi:hypothetical protein
MEIQQARYEASYAACDPDSRLIAAQLEKNWEATLRRIRDLEMRQPAEPPSDINVESSAFSSLADNLSAAWDAPNVTMRARQQLLRALDRRHFRRCRRGCAMSCSRFIGAAANIPTCGSASHRPANMVAPRLKTRWRL